MVRIQIRGIGKIKEPFLRDALADYKARIGGYCQLDLVETPEAMVSDTNPASILKAIQAEGEKLIQSIPSDAFIISLDPWGKQFSSEAFADIIHGCEINGPYQIVFLIGGPHGLAEQCKKRADILLSFSSMTFPHQLVRVILFEQLYRAFTISRGLPYHR